MSNKLGFLAVFALAVSSQVGSGIFVLPISLAPYGLYSLASWIISGVGAVSLALIFALFCAKFPETGGPHVYVKHTFGPTAAFFVGWTYWVISWISTTAVVVASVGYLSPFFHDDMYIRLFLGILLFLIITLINLRGVSVSGRVEFLSMIIKVTVLLAMPIAGLFFFDQNNFAVSEEISTLTKPQILARSTLLTLWCFIGLESATTPAGSVKNPSQTIPRAIVLGTICVAVIYFINNLSIMGLINGNVLAKSKAPYVDAIKIMFPIGNWHLIFSVIASILCISTLNAWVLISGQIALGLSRDNLMPQFFAQKNKYDSPIWGIVISSLGTVVLLILTSNNDFAEQVTSIIDFAVVSFLFVYLACSVAFLKITLYNKNCCKLLIGSIAAAFCCWVIYETPIDTLLTASLFTLSGVPIYFFWYRRSVSAR